MNRGLHELPSLDDPTILVAPTTTNVADELAHMQAKFHRVHEESIRLGRELNELVVRLQQRLKEENPDQARREQVDEQETVLQRLSRLRRVD